MPAQARKSPSKVTLDVDALERDDQEPFVIKIGGKTVTLISTEDLDWQMVASMSPERPYQFFENVIPEDQQVTFLEAKFPAWKMRMLTKAYYHHYGLDELAGNSQG